MSDINKTGLLEDFARVWWASKRLHYNKGLVIAGVTAFILYAILGSVLIAPYDYEFEISLFTILFQGIGYLFMMLIANLFYNLGYFVDTAFNKNNDNNYRVKLYSLGYWFSFCLPFLIPVLTVLRYLVEFY
jgi:hypothetical protein